MKNLFLFLFIFLSAGILTKKYLIHLNLPLEIAFTVFLLSLVFKRFLGLAFLFTGVFLIGFSIAKSQIDIKKIPKDKPVFVECRVTSFPQKYYKKHKFSCKVLDSDLKELIREEIFVISDLKTDFLSNIYALGRLKVKYNKIYLKADKPFIKEEKLKLIQPVLKLRNNLIENLKNASLNEKSFAIGNALIFGDRSYIDKETIKAFQDTGLIHLLAISGLHIAIIFSAVFLAFSMFGKKLAYTVSAFIVAVFPIFASMHIPVLRASSIAVIYSYGKVRGYKTRFLEVLFFVAFASLLINPDILFSVSFQLSFLAVLGIFFFWQNLKFSFKNTILEFTVKSYITSVVASLFLAPILLYYFGKFSISSILFTTPALVILYPYISLEVVNLFTAFIIKPLVWLMDYMALTFIDFVKEVAGLNLKVENRFINIYEVIGFYIVTFGMFIAKVSIKSILIVMFIFLVYFLSL